jgi:hypothetical protein
MLTCPCLVSGVFRRVSYFVLTGKEDHGLPSRTRKSADIGVASGVALSSLMSLGLLAWLSDTGIPRECGRCKPEFDIVRSLVKSERLRGFESMDVCRSGLGRNPS